MSSYVTNNNTRRVKRARVSNSHVANDAPPPSTFLTGLASSKNVTGRRQELVDTVIGSHSSKGLLIVGGSAGQDFNHPNNPDDREIYLGRSGETQLDQLAHPPYPIRFSGPGYLQFEQEVAMPFIRGNMHITGDLVIDGSLSVVNSGTGITFAPVITDALGNGLDGVNVQSTYISNTQIDYFEAYITWTGSTLLAPGEKLRLAGFPLTTYSLTSVPKMALQGGISLRAIGANPHVQVVSGQSYMLLEEEDVNAVTAPTGLDDTNLTGGPGVLHISGWLRKL